MDGTGPDDRLVVAATYERTVHASLERVWENVLDWEHLPWLHARVFDTADAFESGEWGWRGMLGAAGGGAPSPVELIVDGEVGTLQCPWHGYLFDADTGRSRDGRNLRLPSPPQVDLDAVPGRCTLVKACT